MKLLVTGATGMVGRSLLRALPKTAFEVRGAVRQTRVDLPVGVEAMVVGPVGPTTDWQDALSGIDVVIHTAARVHVMHDASRNPLTEFRHVNVYGTLSLAQQAAYRGVRRFVFISSIKVNGEETPLGHPFVEDDKPAPHDAYAISKYEAEDGLLKLALETGMEVVIIRPSLVYGPGVKANFHKIMRWLVKGIPLPLGAIHNKRSMVALENLVDLIVTCIEHPAAANQVFLVGDGEDLSTTDLLRRLGAALGKPARLLPVPQGALEFGLKILGKGDVARRLYGSLQVDISKARDVLGWNPPLCVDEGLKRTAEWYLLQEKLRRVSH